MTILEWITWGILLMAQNAAFTLSSRSRNSQNIWYHTWASFLSNGVWFVSNLILVANFVEIMKTSNWKLALGVGLFYTACTMFGSISMMWLAIRHIEKRK